jgi:hypothetical protein
MAIRKNIFKLVGTAFFVAGFYLLIESQWVYAAVCFLIGFWYFVQSARGQGTGRGKRARGYSSDSDSGNDDNFGGEDFDGGGGDD